MALKDATGKYLTAVGRDAVVQARNRNIGKDELFVVEDSQPQVVFTAHNGKMASIKQGTAFVSFFPATDPFATRVDSDRGRHH